MRIGRTLPPTVAPIPLGNIFRACFSSFDSTDTTAKKFETELKTFFGAKYCFLASSGKVALTLILQALHEIYPDRNEVLIPAFTCYSVPAAIKKAGLKIKLCDLDIDTLDFQREMLQEITELDANKKQLLCAIPTHLFGIPADVTATRKILGPDVPIVEDAAQAMGNEWSGQKLGTLGDISFFSLSRGKALSTIEGGIIITNRDDIGRILNKKLSHLADFSFQEKWKLIIKAFITTVFQHPFIFWLPKTVLFLRLGETIYEPEFELKKLSPVHCVFARKWEERLRQHQKARSKNIRYFFELERKKNVTGWFPWLKIEQPLIRLPILTKNQKIRDRLVRLSGVYGLGVMPSYPSPIHEIHELLDEFRGKCFPYAERLCEQLVTVPVHEYICLKDFDKISILFGNKSKVLNI